MNIQNLGLKQRAHVGICRVMCRMWVSPPSGETEHLAAGVARTRTDEPFSSILALDDDVRLG